MKYIYTLYDNEVLESLSPELAKKFAKTYSQQAILQLIRRANELTPDNKVVLVNMHESGSVILVHQDGTQTPFTPGND